MHILSKPCDKFILQIISTVQPHASHTSLRMGWFYPLLANFMNSNSNFPIH